MNNETTFRIGDRVLFIANYVEYRGTISRTGVYHPQGLMYEVVADDVSCPPFRLFERNVIRRLED